MASTADHHRDALRRSEAIATTLDRSRDFRRASRHTAVVRTMRTALPLLCLLAAGGYGLTVLQRAGWGGGVPAAVVPRITPENLVMNNPHYEGFNPNGGRYTVSARTARQDLARPHVIDLDGITAVTTDANDVRTDLTARQGVFDNQTKLLELAGGVDVVSGSGLKARLATATVEISESIVTSRDPVEVEMTAGRVRASEMKLRHKSREVTFIGSVETHVEPPRPPEAAKTPRAASPPAFGGSGAPIDITSNRLDVNDQTKLAVFSGAVRAVQDGATLSSPHLHVTYSGQAPGLPAAGDKPPTAGGTPTATGDKVAVAAAKPPAAGSAPAGPVPAGKVERITASGPVEMTQASGDRAVSDSADFDAVNDRAYLNGNVVMTQAPDRRAMAQRAEIDQRAETVLLVGEVTISQGSNELRGHRLLSDRRTARTQVTSPKDDGGNGRIAARFVRNPGVGAASAPAPAAAAAKPAAASPFGASFKTDPGAPVDVEAESLDIDDIKKSALFQGNVRAVQGGFTLRTVEMTAFYSGEAGLGGDGGRRDKAAEKPAGKAAAELQRIEARKSVVVQSTDGQTATGDWANYDTRRNTVTLGGDVVLTRGQNTVRGSRLTIDMATGQSIIETEPEAAWSARAQPAGKDGTASPVIQNGGAARRPSAVFYPKQLMNPNAAATTVPAAETAPARPAARATPDAWGPVTRPAGEAGGN